MGTRASRTLFGGAALLMLGMLITFLVVVLSPAQAVTGKQALILNSSVSGGASSAEAVRATNLGFTVNVVSDATWGAMTASDFAAYQLIIVGDPTCGQLAPVVSQNATALADAVMARAGGNTKAGNRILIGTDPRFHYTQGGNKVIDAGIDFAGVQSGASGLYLDFTCRDTDWDANGIPDGQDKLLPLLTIDTSPNWTQNQSPPCGGDVSLISNAAQFSTLKSSDIRGWSCSVHESFPTFPTDWSALAIATDTATTPTCGNDVDTGAARCGQAYLLIAGSGIVSTAPNLSLSPTTATNPVGTPHTVTATVIKDGVPQAEELVDFLVTGANAGAAGVCVPASCRTDSEGKVTFTYTGTKAGDDTINASLTFGGSRQTATASKTWTEGGPPPPHGANADVSIVKTGPASIERGLHIVYTLTVTNNGPATANDVMTSDTLPAGLTNPEAFPGKGTCSISSSTVTCNLGSLASAETVTVDIVASTRGLDPHTASLSNTATVSSTTPDPNSTNNTSTATTTVTP